jgi:hypothetical protein
MLHIARIHVCASNASRVIDVKRNRLRRAGGGKVGESPSPVQECLAEPAGVYVPAHDRTRVVNAIVKDLAEQVQFDVRQWGKTTHSKGPLGP